ncbi:DUF1150 family protein [Oceanicola sp. S124]|uniref:DUF1150 family protein n=1 Tax=Oceanicola sp. S124 TaxID=1042378 RepID=UPI00049444DF|nr:DUF1150 family protein [Oceanicola sp. S124]
MTQKYDFDHPAQAHVAEKIVYVRPVEAADLPEELREQVEGIETLFAVHNSDGERLALVEDRRTAFILARENDLAPVTVH